jgi:hypothetical protein
MAAGLLYVGVGSLFRKDGDDLWVCLPGGLALSAVLVGVPWWLWYRPPPAGSTSSATPKGSWST